MTDFEELILKGAQRIYVTCDNCHLQKSCANALIGCTNYKSFREKPVKIVEESKKNEFIRRD